MLLTVISSIVALSLALWSLHKHSEVNERISKLNSLMVDAMSHGKKTEKKEPSRKHYSAGAIKERLAQRRIAKNHPSVELNKIATEQFEQVKEAEIQQAQYLSEFTNNTKKISQTVANNRQKIADEASKVNVNMQRIKNLPMHPNPAFDISTIKRPDPGEILSRPIEAVGQQIEKIAEKGGLKLNLEKPSNGNKKEMGIFGGSGLIDMEKVVPDTPTVPVGNTKKPNAPPEGHVVTVGDVDLEDLERDLLLLGGR
jgi:hypothetical protein